MNTVAQVRKRKRWLYKVNFERKPTKTWVMGERRKDKGGHILVKTTNGIVSEHRLIMEQKLNRKLESNEVVHHINGIKDDNNLDNLAVMSANDHNLLTLSCLRHP